MKIPGPVQLSKNSSSGDNRIDKLGVNRSLGILFIVVFISGSLSFLFSEHQGFNVPRYSVGDIACADVVVPFDVLIKDEAATESQKVLARENVLPVYRFDPLVGDGQIARLETVFNKCRHDLGSAGIQIQHGISNPTSRINFKNMPHKLRGQILTELSSLNPAFAKDELAAFLVHEQFNVSLEKSVVTVLQQVFSGYIVEEKRNITRKEDNIEVINDVSKREATVPHGELLTLEQARKRAKQSYRKGPQSQT